MVKRVRSRKSSWWTFPLHAACAAQGVSLSELAARTGIQRVQLSTLANGHSRPSWRTLCRIATGLGVSLSAFDLPLRREVHNG
jgi:transcriptional regulator with XRE-family HTH domain